MAYPFQLFVQVMEHLAVVDVSRSHDKVQDEVVLVAGRVRHVGELPLMLFFDEETAFRVGLALRDGRFLLFFLRRQFPFPLLFPVPVNLFIQFLLVLLGRFRHGNLLAFVLVGARLDVRTIDEYGAGIDEADVDRFLQDAPEDALEYGCPLEAAGVVLAEGGELRAWLQKAVADEPPVGDVNVNFLDGLPHAADAKQILDEFNLEKGYRVNAGSSHVVRGIKPFDFLVNEAEVNGTVIFRRIWSCGTKSSCVMNWTCCCMLRSFFRYNAFTLIHGYYTIDRGDFEFVDSLFI